MRQRAAIRLLGAAGLGFALAFVIIGACLLAVGESLQDSWLPALCMGLVGLGVGVAAQWRNERDLRRS